MDTLLVIILLLIIVFTVPMLWLEAKSNVDLKIKLAAVEAERDTALRAYIVDKKTIRTLTKRNKNLKTQIERVGPYERKYNILASTV